MRVEPWETGFVDLRRPRYGGSQGLLGQVDGRSAACVPRWLAARSQAFRERIGVVALDPSTPYAAAVCRAPPNAQIAVDHFHLVLLANQALTQVRQQVTRELLDRHGRAVDPVWANRRLLLRAGDRLSARAGPDVEVFRRPGMSVPGREGCVSPAGNLDGEQPRPNQRIRPRP